MAALASNPTGSLDATRTIPQRLEKLDMSGAFFAELCGSNKTEFSRLMSGVKPLTGTQTEKFYEMLTALEEMVKYFQPLTFTWADPKATREWLRSPSLPNLFKLVTDAQALQMGAAEMTAAAEIIRKGNEDAARIEARIAESQERVQNAWLNFLKETQEFVNGEE